jgi:hypothetical protein
MALYNCRFTVIKEHYIVYLGVLVLLIKPFISNIYIASGDNMTDGLERTLKASLVTKWRCSLKKLQTTTMNILNYSRCPDRNSNRSTTEYITRVL